jgi:predicted phage terminase large subunit-like protein
MISLKSPTLNDVDRELARRHLKDFVKQAWHVLEPPKRPFQDNWHISAICDHLEAISAGHIQNLLINIPPGHMKSWLCSVAWNAWEWIDQPYTRWLTGSYSMSLAVRDTTRTRRLIESAWYQENFGTSFEFQHDQNQKTRYENTETGFRVAITPGMGGTGERGNRIVIDDPHNVRGALSPVQRKEVIDWWDETMPTRTNDPAADSWIVTMQRLHQADLSGHIIETEPNFEHLMLPMEYEPDRKCKTSIQFTDPRKRKGELLFPERFGRQTLATWTRRLGSYGAAGQLQQRPAPRGGGLFQRDWFEIVPGAPADANRVRYWDAAATEAKGSGDPDYTVGCRMSEKLGVFYIEDIRRKRVNPLGVEKMVRQAAELDGNIPVWMEQEGGASGKSMISHFQRNVMKGFAFRGNKVSTSKMARSDPFSAAAEAGNVKIVKGPWNEAYLSEIELFPAGSHDDQVDASSGAFEKLNLKSQPWIEVL